MSVSRHVTEFRIIEEAAAALVQAWASEHCPLDIAPVPVRLIAERVLGLVCSAGYLGRLGRGVVGALVVAERSIVIDERCRSENRLRFTIAHEMGHWVLHAKKGSPDVFADKPGDLLITEGRKRKGQGEFWEREIQANKFAAAVLLPTHVLREYGKDRPVINDQYVLAVAEVFGVSRLTVCYRIEHLGYNGAALGRAIDWETIYTLIQSERGRSRSSAQ